NSGRPHHKTGSRRLLAGDILLMDFGAKYQNYHADLSRTIFVGKASDEHKNIYRHVLTAQQKAIEKIEHGTVASNAYHASNDHFKAHKLDKYFLHGLGHGVGLQIHEEPYLRNLQSKVYNLLTNGMVFSVEPGLYFPWGGVRIEDLVVIKDGKAKLLGSGVDEIAEIIV
ncbi:MAG: M24 family metallopeptidase, partial [Candidatus Curtissbacteria bacterium]|nr:M24 family metallopeptidase [Candidatus Curtissbacteria bacterium]